MKSVLNERAVGARSIFVAIALLAGANSSAWAIGGITNAEVESVKPAPNGHPYEQLLTLEAGPYKPHSIKFTNWNNNTFTYDDSALNSMQVNLAWGIQVTKIGPTALYITPGLSYSSYTLKLPSDLTANPGNVSVTLHMFGLDARVMQAWETFPIEELVPFWEAGVQYSLYTQTSTTDLTAGEGTATNFVAGAGLRYWLNRRASLNADFPNRYVALPIFLTAKVNQVFSNNSGVDPASTSILGGVSIGL